MVHEKSQIFMHTDTTVKQTDINKIKYSRVYVQWRVLQKMK